MEKKLDVLVKGRKSLLTKKKEWLALYSLAVAFTTTQVMATTSDAPWIGMLDKIIKILVGPTARALAILCLVGAGLTIAFVNLEGGVKKLFQAIFGLSIAFAAASWGPKFFGYSGALLM